MAAWAEGSHHGSCKNHWIIDFLFSSRNGKKKISVNLLKCNSEKINFRSAKYTIWGTWYKSRGKKPGITKWKNKVWQLFFPGLVFKGRRSLRSKPALLHAEIWAKALLLLEMFSSSSQRSPEIRCSPALLLWEEKFYFSLQLYKCSAAEQSRACIGVSFLPGTTFGWDTASSGFSLVAKASESIYIELDHTERTGLTHSQELPVNVMDEQQLPWSRGVGAPVSQAREGWSHYCWIWHKFIKNCYDPKLHFLINKRMKNAVTKCCSPLLSINHTH